MSRDLRRREILSDELADVEFSVDALITEEG